MSRPLLSAIAWIVGLLALALSVSFLVPPAPSVRQDPTDFSVGNVIEVIAVLAQQPRAMGSPGNAMARGEIVARLRSLGIEPELQTKNEPDYFGTPGRRVDVVNVIARIPGANPTAAIALIGHYDSEPTSPGANDNAAAVGILLETARAILSGPPLRNDVILLFTDGEEPAPRFGSSAFAAEHPLALDIAFVINLESVGSGGPSLMVTMNGPNQWIIDQYAQAAPYPAAFSFLTTLSDLVGGSNTDLASFRDAGIAGIEYAYLHGSSIYHTEADSPDRVNAWTLEQQGANALALIRHFGNLDFTLPRSDAVDVFFTISRSLVVRYPAAWALPLMLVGGFMWLIAAWRRCGWLSLLRGLGATLATLWVVAMAAVGIWLMLGNWRNTLGIAESYVYLVAFALVAIGIGDVIAWGLRRKRDTAADALGVVAVWWVLGMLTTVLAPGMSYLFLWPTWVAAGLLLVQRGGRVETSGWQLARWTLVSVTTLVLLVPAIDVYYQLAQPRPGNTDSQMLLVIAIPAMLLVLVVQLLRAFYPGGRTGELRHNQSSGGKLGTVDEKKQGRAQ